MTRSILLSGSTIPPERTAIGMLGGTGPQASARPHRVLVDRTMQVIADGAADAVLVRSAS